MTPELLRQRDVLFMLPSLRSKPSLQEGWHYVFVDGSGIDGILHPWPVRGARMLLDPTVKTVDPGRPLPNDVEANPRWRR